MFLAGRKQIEIRSSGISKLETKFQARNPDPIQWNVDPEFSIGNPSNIEYTVQYALRPCKY